MGDSQSSTAALVIQPERPDQPEVIRLIEASDALSQSLYPPESNHLIDVARLCGPAFTFLVARLERRAVGCGAIFRDARGWAEIKRMFVEPAWRGHGIGWRVLTRLEQIAVGDRIALLRLETGIHNAEALAAYRRAGYRECGPFGDYTPDPLSVFMEKRLG
jgi:putative acetyltransferase